MKPGDLVQYRHPWGQYASILAPSAPEYPYPDSGIGIVVNVESWVDKGAPDRNFGMHVVVQWPTGIISLYEYDELEIIADA